MQPDLLDVTVKAGELWGKLDRFREEIDDLAKQNESSKCESDNLQGHRKEMLLFMQKEAKELDMSFDAFATRRVMIHRLRQILNIRLATRIRKS